MGKWQHAVTIRGGGLGLDNRWQCYWLYVKWQGMSTSKFLLWLRLPPEKAPKGWKKNFAKLRWHRKGPKGRLFLAKNGRGRKFFYVEIATPVKAKGKLLILQVGRGRPLISLKKLKTKKNYLSNDINYLTRVTCCVNFPANINSNWTVTSKQTTIS